MKKVLLSILIGLSSGSSLDVTFRYVERSEDDFIRVYVPGEMNNWGPNSNGLISPGASSRMIFSNVTSSSDWLDCSRQTLKTLRFELKDANDNNLNLHGAHVSFSLSFDKYREED